MRQLLAGIAAGALIGAGGVAVANTSVPAASLHGSKSVKDHSVGHLSLKNSIVTCEKLAPELRARVCGPQRPEVVGPPGPAGPPGATGPAGATGATGAAGICKPLHRDPL